MNQLNIVQRIAVYALPLLFALTIREMARAHVAYRLGDGTGKQLGRLSLNPMNYVDPVGTVILPMILLALGGLGGFLIGWPKLVPIDPGRLGHPQRDLGLVAVSGLGANLVMAVLWVVVLKTAVGMHADEGVWLGLSYMAEAGVLLNCGFFVLNLLPLPPFDGGRVLVAVLPPRYARQLISVEPYSFVILILLMFTGLLSRLLIPPLSILVSILLSVAGLDPATFLQ